MDLKMEKIGLYRLRTFQVHKKCINDKGIFIIATIADKHMARSHQMANL